MHWLRTVELLFVLIVHLTLTEAVRTCPEQNELPLECSCSNSGIPYSKSSISCFPNSTTNLTEMFDSIANAFVGTDATFDSLTLMPLAPKQLHVFPEKTMSKTLKFRSIHLWHFDSMPLQIHPNAFPSTYSYTELLFIYNTKFDTAYHPQLFFRNFINLEVLFIDGGETPTIPDHAFDGMKNLQIIYYADTRLQKIGSKAFANLPYLTTLTLSSNVFTPNDISKEAFTGLSPNAKVNLIENEKLTYLPESPIKQLLDITRQPVDLKLFSLNNYMVCDENADWICNNAATYKPKLRGFGCKGQDYNVFECCERKRDSPETPALGLTGRFVQAQPRRPLQGRPGRPFQSQPLR